MNILKVLTKKRITGNIGEDAAARFLKRQGYKILERNFVASGHEVDIIAAKGDYLCFTEVKSRTRGSESPMESRPAASVNYEKQRSLISVARTYFPDDNKRRKIRFDVIEVYLNKDGKAEEIIHMEDAFRADSHQAKWKGKHL